MTSYVPTNLVCFDLGSEGRGWRDCNVFHYKFSNIWWLIPQFISSNDSILGNLSSEALTILKDRKPYNVMYMKKIGNESLFTTTLNLYEAQMSSYSIRNEKLRNKAINKLNKPFNRIETLPFLKGDTLKAAEIAGILKKVEHCRCWCHSCSGNIE